MTRAARLAGKRVLVTRAAHQAGKLSEGLRALGAEPVEVPVIEIRPPTDFAPLDRALRSLFRLRLADPHQREHCARACRPCDVARPHLRQPLRHLNVAAVGEATATAARKAGLAVALVPETYVAESLAKSLTDQIRRQESFAGPRMPSLATSFPTLFAPPVPQSTSSTPTATSCPSPRPHCCARLSKRESTQPLSPAHRASRISPMPRDRPESRFPSQASPPSPSAPSPARPCASSGWEPAAEANPPTFRMSPGTRCLSARCAFAACDHARPC